MAAANRKTVGFTLVEVLLVLVIVGVLATVLMTTIGGQQDKAEIDLTEINIKTLADKMNIYKMNVGHYPTESEGGLKALVSKPSFENEKMAEKWAGPYVDEAKLTDPWGNAINYEAVDASSDNSGVRFKLWSYGPDGQSNTADDIKNWKDDAN